MSTCQGPVPEEPSLAGRHGPLLAFTPGPPCLGLLSGACPRSTPHRGRAQVMGFHPTKGDRPGKPPYPPADQSPSALPEPHLLHPSHSGPTGSSRWRHKGGDNFVSTLRAGGLKWNHTAQGPGGATETAPWMPLPDNEELGLWDGGRSLLTVRGKSSLGARGRRKRHRARPHIPVSLTQHTLSS